MSERRDDLARVAQGALSVATGLADEVRAMARAGGEALTARMELVRRDEFEALRDLAIKAAETVSALEARLAALEEAEGQRQAALAQAAAANNRSGGEGAN